MNGQDDLCDIEEVKGRGGGGKGERRMRKSLSKMMKGRMRKLGEERPLKRKGGSLRKWAKGEKRKGLGVGLRKSEN